MPFNWTDYLTVADKLFNDIFTEASEARLRSAVSRSYYSVFIQLRNHLNEIGSYGSIPLGVESHKIVQHHLANHNDQRVKNIGIKLSRLRINRNKVDYDNNVNNIKTIAKDSLSSAKYIESLISVIN